MIYREATEKLIDLAQKFKCVAIVGARQTGKTTLVKSIFPDKKYISLENLDIRSFAIEDPRGFLNTYNNAILDEIQQAPHLFSYLQEILDNNPVKGQYILTGSNNFLLQQNITQSLAGRVGYLELLPLSISELKSSKLLYQSDEDLILNGFYPPIYDQNIPFGDWCPNYIKTYIEKDVRQIKNISDLYVFEKFLKILAGRTGQEFNANALALDVGVDNKTILSWLSILQSSYIIYLLKPHYQNFNKTIVKRPKIYFYDTSLVCSLLGIRNQNHLSTHPLKGAIFETMVVTEFVKSFTNKGLPISLFYWRDKTGREIDLIIEEGQDLIPIEIKSGKTIHDDFFKNLNYWLGLSKSKASFLLHSGDTFQLRSNGTVVQNWRNLKNI